MYEDKINNIEFNNDSLSIVLHQSQIQIDFVEITKDIYFQQDYWDFASFDKFHNNKNDYTFDFNDISALLYKIYLKRLVLRELFINSNRFPSVKEYFRVAKNFIKYIENNQYIMNVSLINKNDVCKFLNDIHPNVGESRKQNIFLALKKLFLEFEYDNKEFKINQFDDVFNSIDLKKIKIEKDFNKTPNIPKNILNNIIKQALDDLDNNQLSATQRMIAGMILLLSQIGMRIGEVNQLEIHRLKEISILNNSKNAYYLEFFTYKTSTSKNGKWTETRMNDISIKAYNTLVELSKNRRTNNNYLFINLEGNLYHDNTIRSHYKDFFIRNQNKLGFDQISKNESLMIDTWEVKKYDVIDSANTLTKNDIGKILFKINPHQFRVAVANEFKNKGVSLQWIKKHMNHLEEEMTKHYFRDDSQVKDTLFKRSNKDGTQLETDTTILNNTFIKDEINDKELIESYNTINKFLEKKKLNIYKDIDSIINILKNTPIRENEVGYCIKAMGVLCERQDKLTTLEKWYYIKPQIVDISNFDFTYKRFMEKVKLFQHNYNITKSNSNYTRQYELELHSLKQFYNNKFYPELSYLNNEIQQVGKEQLIATNNNLYDVINNIDNISEECEKWKIELQL